MRFATLLLVLLLSACSSKTIPLIDLVHPGIRPEPVINLAWQPNIIAAANALPVSNLSELIARAKATKAANLHSLVPLE